MHNYCPKCFFDSGDNWSSCDGLCPMPMSPHHPPKSIFVFGSNLGGRHGAGSALFAAKFYGAKYGVGVGRTGNAYAIPTKDGHLNVLPLTEIKPYVDNFIDYVTLHKNIQFIMSRIGCGLAGYNWTRDIRPLLPETIPSNVFILPHRSRTTYL